MHSVSFVIDGNVFTIIFRGTLREGPVISYGVLTYQGFHEANLDPHVGALVEKKQPAERRTK